MKPGRCFELGQPRLLQGRIIIVVEAVDADDRPAGLEQPAREEISDEACRAGDQDGL